MAIGELVGMIAAVVGVATASEALKAIIKTWLDGRRSREYLLTMPDGSQEAVSVGKDDDAVDISIKALQAIQFDQLVADTLKSLTVQGDSLSLRPGKRADFVWWDGDKKFAIEANTSPDILTAGRINDFMKDTGGGGKVMLITPTSAKDRLHPDLVESIRRGEVVSIEIDPSNEFSSKLKDAILNVHR